MLVLQVFATTHTRQSFSLASFSSARSLSPVQEHIVRDPTLRRPVTHKRLRQTRTQEPPHTCTQWTQKHSLPRSLSQQHIVCGLFLQGNTQLCDCDGCCGDTLVDSAMRAARAASAALPTDAQSPPPLPKHSLTLVKHTHSSERPTAF